MTISAKTQKMLWGLAAGRCAFPDCPLRLVEDETETDDPALIGEHCHIIGESNNGPRGQSDLTPEQRDKYGNLIILCRNHHRIIDQQPNEYTPERLLEMKRAHESWVETNLGLDRAKLRDDEYYAAIVDEWEKRAYLDSWPDWSGMVISWQPMFAKSRLDDLSALNVWLLSRIWPERHPTLEKAFKTFRLILNDLLATFSEQCEAHGNAIWTEKFYKRADGDENLRKELFRQFEFHVHLLNDLMVELTRACNWVCDEIRACLLPNYRRAEGRVLASNGVDFVTLSTEHVVLTYTPAQLQADHVYPGLHRFEEIRSERGQHFGSGHLDDYRTQH